MKNIKDHLRVVLIMMVLSSCDSLDHECVLPTACEIEDIVESGTWEITLFAHLGIDKTSNFEAYVFSINEIFMYANSAEQNISYTGSWSVIWLYGLDEYTLDDVNVSISFSLDGDLGELSGVWDFISISESKIELKHIIEETGEVNYLTLEKQ
ncbi:MAG: hypothetical protein DA407_08640 [Bacteroidetes bacterium]|nr:MAG: hypothetical protein DA407_08640 [Bacteroidota bacterium]